MRGSRDQRYGLIAVRIVPVVFALTLMGCSIPSDVIPPGPGSDSGPPCLSASFSCQGDDLYMCDGQVFVETCPLGCDAVAERCVALVPSNGIDPMWLTESEVAFDTTSDGISDYLWSTSTGSIGRNTTTPPFDVVRGPGEGIVDGIGFHVVVQGPNLPDIGVWTFASVNLTAGEIHHFTGEGGIAGAPRPAAAIVADGAIVIEAVLDISARLEGSDLNERSAGAGGWEGGIHGTDLGNGNSNGAGPGFGGGIGATCDDGGGGAGHGALGGDGGDGGCASTNDGGGETGTPTLTPLIGASGGGAGGGSHGGQGGGGGGALQIVSNERIHLTGTIVSAGGGGRGAGEIGGGGAGGGGGGGAGGAVLLEAPTVEISGVIAANGGGGGAGNDASAVGGHGEPGLPSDQPASGAPSLGGESAAGGSGGALGAPAGESGDAADNGGGGGGAAGRIRIYTRTGSAAIDGSATLSPAASEGVVSTN